MYFVYTGVMDYMVFWLCLMFRCIVFVIVFSGLNAQDDSAGVDVDVSEGPLQLRGQYLLSEDCVCICGEL